MFSIYFCLVSVFTITLKTVLLGLLMPLKTVAIFFFCPLILPLRSFLVVYCHGTNCPQTENSKHLLFQHFCGSDTWVWCVWFRVNRKTAIKRWLGLQSFQRWLGEESASKLTHVAVGRFEVFVSSCWRNQSLCHLGLCIGLQATWHLASPRLRILWRRWGGEVIARVIL